MSAPRLLTEPFLEAVKQFKVYESAAAALAAWRTYTIYFCRIIHG